MELNRLVARSIARTKGTKRLIADGSNGRGLIVFNRGGAKRSAKEVTHDHGTTVAKTRRPMRSAADQSRTTIRAGSMIRA